MNLYPKLVRVINKWPLQAPDPTEEFLIKLKTEQHLLKFMEELNDTFNTKKW